MRGQRTYQFGQSRLTLEFGDITESKAQVIVSSDDSYLTMSGGVSAAILRTGGNAIAIDAAKKVPASLGEIVVTTAGILPAQYIFHVITIAKPWTPRRDGPQQMSPKEIVQQATGRCMQVLEGLQLSSIAFPAIGAGAAGFSSGDVAVMMADVITEHLKKRAQSVDVTIYLFDRFQRMTELDFVRFFEEFASRTSQPLQVAASERPTEPVKSMQDDGLATTADDIKKRRLLHLRNLLSGLEDQRYKLEERLIEHMGNDNSADTIKKVRENLAENEELRIRYLSEWKILFGQEIIESPTAETKERSASTVFVSSTYTDLIQHRNAVKEQIARRDLRFRGMEHFGAEPDRSAPAAKIAEEVRKADVYIGVFGVRYGSIDSSTGLSMTELEFKEAEASRKPMLLYLMHENANVRVSDIESNPESKRKLDDLKGHIRSLYLPYMFMGVEDLARQVYEDLGKLGTVS